MSEIRRYPDKESLAQAAADLFVATAAAAIKTRGRFTVALSGGSTPEAMHRLLALESYRERVDWSNVHVYWGDERTVPPDHADSNYRMACETLLDHVPVPEAQIHRMRGEIDPPEASKEYGLMLKATFGHGPGFDLLLLGMGDDGHTLSLFPGTTALHEAHHRVRANYVPKLDTWRVTLTAHFANTARVVAFLVSGANKADALEKVMHGPRNVESYPAQLIQPVDGSLFWLVDDAAAARLRE